ncbi:NAD(P)-binding protein [Exidia glandulosa HHB12029]|uniref:NAD(P)-binding protein n=1 Tax=Exidia glandulosa HHB12029 TaxID=1314781 RepID=A0A165G0W8_EXIGL|nr:NAD(P)-binding protein [Exidia glandulosa HHB12029]
MTTTIPPTTRALGIYEHGGPEVIRLNEVPSPQPAPGHIIVKVEWAGVNFVDNYKRSGLYPNKSGKWPLTLGEEATSYAARGFALGQRVVVNYSGAYTEYFSSPWEKVFPIPEGVDTRTAAAVFVQALTVITEIRESYAAKKGDTILIHAAAGGLGLIFCSLLTALGVRVIGTASTKQKADLAKAHGASEVLLYAGPEKEDIEARVLELTDGKGVHAIFDGVGKDTWELDFKVIRLLGTIVFVGNASGPVPPFPVLKLSEKNTKICRPTLVHSMADPVAGLQYAEIVWASLKDGSLRVNVHEEYEFSAEGLRKAHEDIAGRKTTGKLLIKVSA